MSPQSKRKEISILSLGYICLGILLLPYYQYELNPDWLSYLSIARKYQEGLWQEAVNTYWSPLISWLYIPFLKLFPNALLAGKILMLLCGWVNLLALRKLCLHFGLPTTYRYTFLAVTAVSLLSFTCTFSNADVLLSGILLWYLVYLYSPSYLQKPGYPFVCGALGGLAYLAKAYGLFFFVCHFILFHSFHIVSLAKGERSKRVKDLSLGLFTCLLIVAFWAIPLSIKNGKFTLSEAGAYNFAFIGPESLGEHKMVIGGLYPPVSPSSLSIWEQPQPLSMPSWTPWESSANFKHYLRRIYLNFYLTAEHTSRHLPLLWLLPLGLLGICRKYKWKLKSFPSPLPNLLAAGLLFWSGYALLLIEYRYLYFAFTLATLLWFYLLCKLNLLSQLASVFQKIILSILFLIFTISPALHLIKNINMDKVYADWARELPQLRNARLASDSRWFESLFLSYHLNATYLGAINDQLREKELMVNLQQTQTDYFICWKDAVPAELSNKALPAPNFSTPFKIVQIPKKP